MHGIGEFAHMAKVSVRTLRHYDEIGLLEPARVDPSSGYRSYAAAQLSDLHRILALKDAGLSLSEIRVALGEDSDAVVAMLRERLIESEAALDAERQRTERLRARLKLMTGEHPMATSAANPLDFDASIVVKPVDGHRLASATETASDFEADFGPIFGRLYPIIYGELARLGIVPGEPTVAFYDQLDDGQVLIAAGVPIPTDAVVDSDLIVVTELDRAERAATLVHRGSMATIDQSYLALDQWISDAGERPAGYSREIYHACPPNPDEWVTELQFVLA